MPTRLIREGILDSDAVNSLSFRGEILYRRLMSVADDHGRFDGRLEIIRSRLFALVFNRWQVSDVAEAIDECCKVGLVRRYVVDNKPYILIQKFNQQTRSKPKYPDPITTDNNCFQLCTQTETETDAKTEAESSLSETGGESVHDSRTAEDWSPWPHAEQAREAILDAYPNKQGQTAARVYWQAWLPEAVDAPKQARGMYAAAKLIADRCPPEKVQFLGGARKFLAETWADPWPEILDSWNREKPGKVGNLMEELERMRRES